MLGAPSLDAGNIGRTFEVVLVLRFGPPARLGLALTLGTTGELRTKALVTTIARIGSKEAFAMQALTKANGRRHSGGKKTQPSAGAHAKAPPMARLGKKTHEENRGRTKKKFS